MSDADAVVEGDSDTLLDMDGVSVADTLAVAEIEALTVAVTEPLPVELLDSDGDAVDDADTVADTELDALLEVLTVADPEADADAELLAVPVADTLVVKDELCKMNERENWCKFRREVTTKISRQTMTITNTTSIWTHR